MTATEGRVDGKVCLVTGATSGVGAATAEGLARRGATVVIVGRDPAKCAATVARIRAATGRASVEHLRADLSSRAEVRALADAFRRRHRRLDVLVNNAGAMFTERREGVDGIEMTLALNHLGYFLRRIQVWVFQDFIRTLGSIDLRPAQYSVLSVIAANRGLSQADVAQLLGIERARLVRLLDRLERRGLTQRLASPVDRRSHALHLTPAGQALLKRARALAQVHEANLVEKLGAANHARLLEALREFGTRR